MRILITGGTGFVGTYLIRTLQSTDAQIAVLASTEPQSREAGVEYRIIDIRDFERVREFVSKLKPDYIYHLAGISNLEAAWKQPLQTYEVNVFGTHNLFNAIINGSSPCRILNVSTSQVYAPSTQALTETSPVGPDNPYGASKAMAELLVSQYRGCDEVGIVTARSFNHTGPGQSPSYVLPSIAKQFAEIELGVRPPTLILGNTQIKRDFTDVRDVVRAYCMLVKKGNIGEVYNVCSGVATALSDIIVEFQAISGRTVTIERDTNRMREKDADEIRGDRSKIWSDTGWRPEIPLKKTLHDLFDYWRGECQSRDSVVRR